MHTLIIDALQAIFAQFPIFITQLQSDIVVAIKRGAHSNFNLALSASGGLADERARAVNNAYGKQSEASRRELFKRGNNFGNYSSLVMTNANALV